MANDLPANEAHALGVTQRPIATIALTQNSGVPGRPPNIGLDHHSLS
jgi:hypothetical protein